MAGVSIVALSSAISVDESATKTIAMLIAASHHRVLAKNIEVLVTGGAVSDRVRVELCQLSDSGSGGSSLAVSKRDTTIPETIQTTGIQGPTSEPSSVVVVAAQEVSAGGGIARFPGRDVAPLREIPIAGGTRLGVRIMSAPDDLSVRVNFEAEE